jgi:CPA2 family monovalent cation:H+ antiporter-2
VSVLFTPSARRRPSRDPSDRWDRASPPVIGGLLASIALAAVAAAFVATGYTPAGEGVEATAPAILELGAVLLVAAAAGWLARRVGLPAVVGYVLVGLAVSPFTPGFVADRQHLEVLADVGVVLLLFEVGIEVDPLRLRREQRGLLWAAPAQTVITTVIAGALGYIAGLQPAGAALFGLCVALSSSVVIVNITRSRRRTTDVPTERALLGWSVVQDITGVTIAVALLAVVGTASRPLPMVLLGLGGFAVLAVAGAWVLPRMLRLLLGERDLFLIVSVATGLTIAGVGSVFFGVPLALAAFVSGLAIVETDESATEARRQLLPFRDLFAVLFFVAVGTLIDPSALQRGLPWLALILALLVLAKVGVAYLLARRARLPSRPLQLATGLGQIGEFSFVLASAGAAVKIIPVELYAALLASVAVSIVGSTVGVRLVGRRPVEPA